MPNGDRPGREDSDLHLTWQERNLLKELVEQDAETTSTALITDSGAGGEGWATSLRVLSWRHSLLQDIRAKLVRAGV